MDRSLTHSSCPGSVSLWGQIFFLFFFLTLGRVFCDFRAILVATSVTVSVPQVSPCGSFHSQQKSRNREAVAHTELTESSVCSTRSYWACAPCQPDFPCLHKYVYTYAFLPSLEAIDSISAYTNSFSVIGIRYNFSLRQWCVTASVFSSSFFFFFNNPSRCSLYDP